MSERLQQLLESCQHIELTDERVERMIESFAFGNLHLEDESVTREMIRQAALRESKY